MLVVDTDGHGFDLRPIECPTCRIADESVVGWRGGEHHRHRRGIATRIVRCRRCGLIYPNPFPYPREPQTLYGDPEKYFELHDPNSKIESGCQLVREIVIRAPSRSLRLLDVGSGRGELLEAARREGVKAVGLEFSQAMIQYAHDRYGVEVVSHSIESLAQESPVAFDAIVLNAVLEHVYDPDSMISAAAKLSSPGAILYIDIPQEPNLLTHIGNTWNRLRRSSAIYNLSPTWPPFHVFGFNRRSLDALLTKHGFRIDSVRVFATPKIPARKDWSDRFRAFVGTQINRLANLTGTASNMYVWARKSS